MRLLLFAFLFLVSCQSVRTNEPCAPPASDECARALIAEERPDDTLITVEQMPRVVGGMSALHKQLVYPQAAIDAKVEGQVVLLFTVKTDGLAYNIEVVRGIGSGCDEAAVAAIKAVTFIPGFHEGQAVETRMAFPITFQL